MTKGLILVAPGQPEQLTKPAKDSGKTIVVDSTLPVDVQFGTVVGLPVMGEVKGFPGDFVSSWHGAEGRLTRQTISLSANQGPSFVLLVGKLETDREGQIVVPEGKWRGKPAGLGIPYLIARQLHWAMLGIAPIWVTTWSEAGYALNLIYDEMQKAEHTSHLIRPNWSGKNKMPTWESASNGDRINYIFQGFESVGYKTAERLWHRFGDFQHFAVATQDMIMGTPLIGPKTALAIYKQLTASWDDFHKDGK